MQDVLYYVDFVKFKMKFPSLSLFQQSGKIAAVVKVFPAQSSRRREW